jgi:predicted  nucleic acid-binding Zn-ribbon protein
MSNIDQQFNTINDKLQQLLKRMVHLQRENEQLRADLQAVMKSEATAQAQIDELKQQAAILKFAAGQMSERDKKEFETTISRYIRQIDKCITYLSQ